MEDIFRLYYVLFSLSILDPQEFFTALNVVTMTHCTYDKHQFLLSFIFEYSMRPVVFKIPYPRFWLFHWSPRKDTYLYVCTAIPCTSTCQKVKKRKHNRYHREYRLRPDTLLLGAQDVSFIFPFSSPYSAGHSSQPITQGGSPGPSSLLQHRRSLAWLMP